MIATAGTDFTQIVVHNVVRYNKINVTRPLTKINFTRTRVVRTNVTIEIFRNIQRKYIARRNFFSNILSTRVYWPFVKCFRFYSPNTRIGKKNVYKRYLITQNEYKNRRNDHPNIYMVDTIRKLRYVILVVVCWYILSFLFCQKHLNGTEY